ncbi:TPA: FtsX-like permease family protein [Pseudomonas aeruginosa]|uniref:ABC transporter permease n=1 Tax=Pseudomonas aeruginosa TaxID=287 RepID=UPI00106C5FA3|nr:FtsX-like permease family protein [Pseudomonas aeruginosa]HDY6334754.1 FtsX-like permease family protein [Pseudomonas aeruginosa]
MPLSRLLSLAARQLFRESRSGELRVLFFALLIAVASSTAIGYFSARLNGAMLARAAEFLGADLVLNGTQPASAEQIERGTRLGLRHADSVEFSSVIATDQGIQLSSIKAVGDRYPLRGQLKSAAAPFAAEQAGGRPQAGEVWVESRLLVSLDLKVGDSIEIGRKPLRIARILTYEPDRAGDFYSLTPRAMMSLADLDATGVVQPGSRVRYRDLWEGPPEALQAYRQQVKGSLAANQRLQDARDGNRQVGDALGRAERYLNLASLAAVLLAGVAVALSAARFAARRYDASALLRCLGLSRSETLLLYALQLLLLGLLASAIGALLGWLAQLGLFRLLATLLPPDVPAGGLILLAMALIALLRGELLDTWQAQLPPDAPNHFALNILPTEKDAFERRVQKLSPGAEPLFPMVPGRLVAVNGKPVQALDEDVRSERALQRDLGLTWSEQLPSGNQLTAGRWWSAPQPGALPGVSVEEKLAANLRIQVGDRLTFSVAGQNREVQVQSLRKVKWDNFQPNFFMVFQPGTLTDLPVTYLTSFYLPASQERDLIELARAFPTVTLLPVDALLSQLRSILDQVTLAVEYVLVFVLAAGFVVLFAGLQATLDERVRQGALLRALGAERELLQRTRRVEFALLGAVSGLLAALGCEAVSLLLYRLVFDLPWQAHPWLLALPLVGAVLVGGAGLLGTRRALNSSPLRVLREG